MVGKSKILGLFAIFIVFLGSLVYANSAIEPISININESNATYVVGEEITLDFEAEFGGPFSSLTNLEVSLADLNFSGRFLEVLDAQGISYAVENGTSSLSGSTDEAHFAFNDLGEQIIYLRVDSNEDTFSDLDFEVLGSEDIKLPYLDFGADGIVEWKFFGDFLGFSSDYLLSETLTEDDGGDIIITNEKSNYWCEQIDLPLTRDLQVYVKMEELDVNENISATLIQLSDLECKSDCEGFGGQYTCDVDIGSSLDYYSCDLSAEYTLEGEFLVCIYNEVQGDGQTQQAKLRIESNSPNSAYVCNVDGDSYDCNSQGSDDFLIKVKAGDYNEVLNGNANFMAGLINNYEAFITVLNYEISNCMELDDGKCAIPLKVGSSSSGVLTLKDLNMEYNTASGLKSTNNFYMGIDIGQGLVYELGEFNLTDLNESIVLNMSTEGLYIYAPEVNFSGNYNLELSFNPGPSDSISVEISTFTEGLMDSEGARSTIQEHIDFLESEETNYGDVLEVMGLNSDVSFALSGLNDYLNELDMLNGTNQSEMDSFIEDLNQNIDTLMENTPKVISVLSSLDDEVVIEPSDVLAEMVPTGDLNDAYYLQNDFNVKSNARYVEVVLFNDIEIKGSIIRKEVSGSGSNYYVYETIPAFVSTNEPSFIDGFSQVKSGNINLYRSEYSNVMGASYNYFFENEDVTLGLKDMKTVLIPKAGVMPRGSEEIPVCGDNKCAVLMVDGEKIYLEDAISCPQDCAKKVNWGGILMVFMIGVLIIVAVAVYFRFMKKKVGGKGDTVKKSQFASEKDETQLREYISKSIASGATREKITKILLERGWKKEQIDYAFKPKIGKPKNGKNIK